MQGLVDNSQEVKKLTCVDLVRSDKIDEVAQLCQQLGIDFQFIQGDDTEVDLPEADMYFIDTWHIYGHLKRELAKMAPLSRQYILMHDTTVDEWCGETVRNNWDPVAQSQASGYPLLEVIAGLWPAILEFLAQHENEWFLHQRLTNNNGLTALERTKKTT